jgi:hypothetical protein
MGISHFKPNYFGDEISKGYSDYRLLRTVHSA